MKNISKMKGGRDELCLITWAYAPFTSSTIDVITI